MKSFQDYLEEASVDEAYGLELAAVASGGFAAATAAGIIITLIGSKIGEMKNVYKFIKDYIKQKSLSPKELEEQLAEQLKKDQKVIDNKEKMEQIAELIENIKKLQGIK